MSQRKALIASIAITAILALSAIGFRAAMVDSPGDDGSPATQTALSVESGAGRSAFNDDAYEDDHESGSDQSARSSDDDDDDRWDHDEEHDDEEDDDDD